MNNVQCDNEKCKFNIQGDCDSKELLMIVNEGVVICTTSEESEGE